MKTTASNLFSMEVLPTQYESNISCSRPKIDIISTATGTVLRSNERKSSTPIAMSELDNLLCEAWSMDQLEQRSCHGQD